MKRKNKVSDFIIKLLQRRHKIEKTENIENLNYVEKGYVDSLGIIKFVAEIEDEFGIEFSDEELASPSFKVLGELIKLVERKIERNE